MPAKSKSGGGRGKSKSGTGASARGKTAARASNARGKQSAKTSTAAVKGRAGRPPRLSRDMVLETSIALLERHSVEQFTMARVAKALNTVSMALYNYFPSRDALLAAIADHICMQFTMPKPKRSQTWQDTLWQWLWALKKHTDDYPVIVEVMGAEGRYSAGWLRITLTVSRTLYENGLRGHDLALHAWMFCSNALATIVFEREGSAWRSPISLTELDQLERDEQDFLIMLRKENVELSSQEILDLAFHQLIANLERALQTPGTAD
jgi:AcrR family transcriptional regulator